MVALWVNSLLDVLGREASERTKTVPRNSPGKVQSRTPGRNKNTTAVWVRRQSKSLIDLEMLPNVRDGIFLPCSTVGINFASIQICEAAKLWAGKSGAAFFFLKGGNVDTLSHQKDWGLGSMRAAMERKWLHMTEKRNLRGHLLHQVLLHFVVIAKRQGTLFFLRTRLKTFVNGESAEAVTVKWKTKQKYGKAISIFNWVNIAVTHPSFSCKTSVATKIRARGCTFVHVIRYFPLLMCGLQTVNTDYILRLLLGLACIVH